MAKKSQYKSRSRFSTDDFYRSDGTLRQRKDGRYELVMYYIDEYDNANRKSFYGQSASECYFKADEFRSNYNKKELPFKNSKITIAQIIKEKYDTDLAMNFVAPAGYQRNLSNLHIIESHVIGQIPIQIVDKRILSTFLIDITGYSNSVIEILFLQLKLAFNIAHARGIIQDNIMLSPEIRRPKSRKADKKIRALTEDEQKLLVDFLTNVKPPAGRNDYRLQLLIELYSGLRMGEINALKRENIDFEAGMIHVRGTISRGMGYKSVLNETTKTGAGVRDVPISKTLKPILEEAVNKMRRNEHDLLFYDFNKKTFVTTMQVNDYYRRVCKRIGIEHNGQHSLRHTFATRCIEAGIQPVVLKTWLGHTDIHVTLDTYADVFDKLNNTSLNLFDDYLENI